MPPAPASERTHHPVVGVLLAGGRASRFGGGDKCLLKLAGRPLLAYAIERLSCQVDVQILNANGDPGRFAEFGLPVVADTA
jgi:molybdopterin-guanine dinucleotide biosynthesis protein A